MAGSAGYRELFKSSSPTARHPKDDHSCEVSFQNEHVGRRRDALVLPAWPAAASPHDDVLVPLLPDAGSDMLPVQSGGATFPLVSTSSNSKGNSINTGAGSARVIASDFVEPTFRTVREVTAESTSDPGPHPS